MIWQKVLHKSKLLQAYNSVMIVPVKGSVNPEIVKNIAHCNFVIVTVIYIKVHISGMEMSQRICFWHQILPKILIFLRKWQKITFLVKKKKKK